MFAAIMIIGLVAGVILGSRFKVFVLVPAILFATANAIAISFAHGLNLPATVLAVLAVLTLLQCGYFGGVTAAHFAVRTKMPRRTWRPSQFY